MATRKKKVPSEVAELKHKLKLATDEVARLTETLALAREESRTDALTGIPNRRALDEALQREFARAQRHGTPLVVAYADLDHLKTLNGLYGHDVGDEAIKVFARILCSSLRGEDFCARRGGDEFMLVLPSTSQSQAGVLVDRLAKKVQEHLRIKVGDEMVRASASFGFAELRPEEEFSSFMKRANEDLYRWKQTRRPTFRGGE